nr:MAG TPA: hypothetical protein [Caudoviricetes sp.]
MLIYQLHRISSSVPFPSFLHNTIIFTKLQ